MPPDKNKSVFGSNSVNCLLDTIHYRHQNTVELRCFHKIPQRIIICKDTLFVEFVEISINFLETFDHFQVFS